jgi:hypothetical protein
MESKSVTSTAGLIEEALQIVETSSNWDTSTI